MNHKTVSCCFLWNTLTCVAPLCQTQSAKTRNECSVDDLYPELPSQVCFCWIDSHPRLLVRIADQIPSLQSHEGLDWDPHLRSALRVSGKQHRCRHFWRLSAKHDGEVWQKKDWGFRWLRTFFFLLCSVILPDCCSLECPVRVIMIINSTFYL